MEGREERVDFLTILGGGVRPVGIRGDAGSEAIRVGFLLARLLDWGGILRCVNNGSSRERAMGIFALKRRFLFCARLFGFRLL